MSNNANSPERSVNLLVFSLIAIFVGVVTGFGAVLFRALIAFVHNLLFFGILLHFLRRQHLHARLAVGRCWSSWFP